MGLFSSRPYIKALILREDYKVEPTNITVDEMASDILTISKDGNRQFSWLLIHQLLKPVYGFPGIKDGTKCLLVNYRDVRFDPLNELDKTWSNETIRQKMREVAKEQQHKAEKSSALGILQKSQLLLASAAVILILAVVVIGVLKYFGG